jgi:hypothetical protein
MFNKFLVGFKFWFQVEIVKNLHSTSLSVGNRKEELFLPQIDF